MFLTPYPASFNHRLETLSWFTPPPPPPRPQAAYMQQVILDYMVPRNCSDWMIFLINNRSHSTVTSIRNIFSILCRFRLGRLGLFSVDQFGLISWVRLIPQSVDHWQEARAFRFYFLVWLLWPNYVGCF